MLQSIQSRKGGKETEEFSSLCLFLTREKNFQEAPRKLPLMSHWPELCYIPISKSITDSLEQDFYSLRQRARKRRMQGRSGGASRRYPAQTHSIHQINNCRHFTSLCFTLWHFLQSEGKNIHQQKDCNLLNCNILYCGGLELNPQYLQDVSVF